MSWHTRRGTNNTQARMRRARPDGVGTAVSTRSAARPPSLRMPTKRVTASINQSLAEALKRPCRMKPAQRRAVAELPILPDSRDDLQELSDLIGDVYDTVLDQSLWEGVIARAAQFVRGTGASLYSKDVANQEG